jgi:dienelactone hydrolase
VLDLLPGWEKSSFSAGDITHDVFRRGAGPAVIVISEIPGITPNVVGFARRVLDLGCTAVLPHLFGIPGKPPSGLYVMDTITRVCISREFSGFAMGRSSPIIDWLRILARAEHERCGGPGVGVVGMCFTGGFGLAMTVEETVVAPVLSQPSLPFPVTRARRSDIQVSTPDWAKIQARAEQGLCVLGLRFTGDKAVPAERFQLLRQKLGDRFMAVELDSSPGNSHGHPRMAHSVLTEHLQDREGTPTRAALDQVLGFLGSRLGVTAQDV